MSKFRCEKQAERCVRCGSCCSFQGSISFTPSQDKLIKERLFEETGFIYLYPFRRFGLGIQSYEYEKAMELAKKRGIKLKILPKKLVYDAKTRKAIVFDWFLDHKVCQFLKNNNECIIYDQRFELCRLFPETDKKTPKIEERLRKMGKLISDGKILLPRRKSYDELVKLAKKAEKINFEDLLQDKI